MENLQNVRELMVKAANGTNGVDELNYIQSEINDNVAMIQGTNGTSSAFYAGSAHYVGHGGFTSYLDNGYGSEVFMGATAGGGFKKDSKLVQILMTLSH